MVKRKTKKKNLMKKIISMLLAIVMVLSLITVNDYVEVKAATGNDIVAFAKQYLGYPYVRATHGPNSFDCSGFVNYVYGHFGIYISPSSWDIQTNYSKYGRTVSNPKPGDIVVWDGHVAIYEGNGYIINALNPSYGVCEIKMSRFVGGQFKFYLRVLNDNPPIVIPKQPSYVNLNRPEGGIGDAVTATWGASAGATSYNVKLICTTNSAYNQSMNVGGTSASFSIKNAGNYKISVSASNSAGTSGATNSGSYVANENVKVKYVDWEGNVIGAEQIIKWGSNSTAPTAPPREGYTFQNWSSDGRNVKSNITISAVYKINTYAVSFVDYKGDVIGSVQKINYNSSATPPTNIPTKKGYIFTGWNTEEYKLVKKSLTVQATYVWENSDLPIITEIKSAVRNSEATGYNIEVELTNFPDDFTKGKLVATLMTKDDKMVASETKSVSMPESGEVNEKFTILYSGLASRVQVSMIGVMDDDTTGTPKSKIVSGAVDVGNEWSDWSTTVPTGDDIISESRTEYRYKNSMVIKATGTPTTPAGYSLTNTYNTGTYSSWGNWSGWSRSSVSANNLCDVQAQTGYRICAFVCSACGNRDPFSGQCAACGRWNTLYWDETIDTMSGYNRGYVLTAHNGDNIAGTGKARVIVNGTSWYFELNGNSNGAGGTGQVTYPIYRYRTRQEYKNYTYWQNEFGNWQAEKVDASSTRQVETRTTYRFKTNTTEVPCYNYKRYKYTNINNGKIVYTYTSAYADSMEYPGEWEYNKAFIELKKVATVDDNISLYNGTGENSWYRADVNNESESKIYKTKDTLEDTKGVKRNLTGKIEGAAGKVATLLVYKGQNEDPIASQIEYIGQTIIDTEGNYKFDYITKEEPTAKTGDFIITLGIEGSTNYQIIGKIEAPKQVFTVDFVDDLGNSIGEQKKVADGGTVEAPKVPDKEGYDFIGWDTGLKNIRENMVITAQYKKKKYNVIFVDWDNTALDVQEYEYGATLDLDKIPQKEGQKFSKWINNEGEEIKIVKDNMIVEASYIDTKYSVVFKDWNGNVISKQELSYGEQAVFPDDLEAPNNLQVFQAWDRYDSAMYVTSDVVILPVAKYVKDSEKPKYSIEDIGGNKKSLSLYSTKGSTDIFYAVDNLEDEEVGFDKSKFDLYEDEIILNKDAKIYAYARSKDSNESEIEVINVFVNGESESSEHITQKEEPFTNEEPISERPTENNTQEESSSNNHASTSLPVKPQGLVVNTDNYCNYEVFWQTDINTNYYNIYVNDVMVGNSVGENFTIPASIFVKAGKYTIGVEAVNNAGVSERNTIIYVVEETTTTQNKPTDNEITTTLDKPTEKETTSIQNKATEKVTAQKDVSEKVATKEVTAPKKVATFKTTNIEGKRVIAIWKQVSGIKGYQLQYALNKKFTKGKKTVKAKSFDNFKVVKKLKKNKVYYFRIRAYKLNGKAKVYGAWSKVKKVKIKK